MKKNLLFLIAITLLIPSVLTSCTERELAELTRDCARYLIDTAEQEAQDAENGDAESGRISEIDATSPEHDSLADLEYDGRMSVVIDKNKPSFTKKEKRKIKEYLRMSDLDSLGRCGEAKALVSNETLAKTERGSIGMIRPSGWPKKVSEAKYDIVEGKYLYNRCHLIMYALYGEATNDKRNLITGTRMLNVGSDSQEGMLTYENKILEYVRTHRGNKVLYRVTPIFRGKELVARGVHMEAFSTNDNGKGIKFNVYIHNHQDGIKIDYRTGASMLA